MSWWGKVIGGALGFAIGGPIGAMLGMAVGHQIDAGPMDWPGLEGGNERAQTAFFTVTFSVMGHLAKADGSVSEVEIRMARAVMAHMRLSPDQERAAIRLFEQGKGAGFPMREVLEQFRRETHDRRDLARMFLEIQVQFALADGVLHEAEHRLLEAMCVILGVSSIELQTIIALVRAQFGAEAGTGQGGRAGPRQSVSPADGLRSAYAVLGIGRSASDAEVKRAYRKLMNEHHPDKLVSRGMPEEMVQIAQEKTAEISKAYDLIKEHRGMR
jgi:DnaJ like chaperone protein